MSEPNGDGNGTKTDIQWIKDTLKEHGDILKKIDDKIVYGGDQCRRRHDHISTDLTGIHVALEANKGSILVVKKEAGLLALLVSAFTSLVGIIIAVLVKR